LSVNLSACAALMRARISANNSIEEVDTIYLDAPNYMYPDGEPAAETFRVIGEAIAIYPGFASARAPVQCSPMPRRRAASIRGLGLICGFASSAPI
jgi:non-homologous end joining protein Ku